MQHSAIGHCSAVVAPLWLLFDVSLSCRAGSAMQAGLHCCKGLMQDSGSAGSAAWAHFWGPVCADLLLVPGQHPNDQHQASGILAMSPVLAQMGELQDRVKAAAAELVALTLQVS